MRLTEHFKQRLSQRGIKYSMMRLVLQFGKQSGDKCVLNRKAIDALLIELERVKKDVLKMRERGGVVVIKVDDALITSYGIDG